MPARSEAPGELEDVRAFLNTWVIPNDTRVPVDELGDVAGDDRRWVAAMPSVPAPARSQLPALRRLRADLRRALGHERPVALQPRFDRLRLHAVLAQPGEGGPAVRFVSQRATAQSALLRIVLEAVRAGQWQRLKACPDCQWVFYDTSRNARRTWCSMTAGPGTRGCGSIAKTRTYRARLDRHSG